MSKHTIAQWKKDAVSELVSKASKYNVIGIVDTSGIPADIMQKMRADIRTFGDLVVMKKTLIKNALLELEKDISGISKLSNVIDGQAAFILTNVDSFKLYRKFEEGKKKAPAKGGEKAPEDISVKKGETSFKPGPIISEFGKAGIPAAIEKGKVVIKKDTLLVKQGEKIPREVAMMITKLDILPITLGMNLCGTFEDKIFFNIDVLNVNLAEFETSLTSSIAGAFNLAFAICYPAKETIVPLVQKGFMEALSLSLDIGYVTSENADIMVQNVYRQALSLAGMLPPEAVDDEIISLLGSCQAATSSVANVSTETKQPEKEEEAEEEEVSEEDAAAGLGALFG